MKDLIRVEKALEYINSDYKHVVEFGVYMGTTLTNIKTVLGDNYKYFGFDSFEGLPEDWVGTQCHKGFFSTDGVIPSIEGAKIYKGWFEDTIHDYLKEADTIALLHVDCDLYSSTKTIFNNLHPYIKKGTLIAFDEWCYNFSESFNDHEQKAFYEYVEQYNVQFEFIDYPVNDVETKLLKIL
jgi:hypothetical protein